MIVLSQREAREQFKVSIEREVEYWCVDFEFTSSQTPEVRFVVSSVSYDLPLEDAVINFQANKTSELKVLGVGFELAFRRVDFEGYGQTQAVLTSTSYSQLDLFPWPDDPELFVSTSSKNISCTKIIVDCCHSSLERLLQSILENKRAP